MDAQMQAVLDAAVALLKKKAKETLTELNESILPMVLDVAAAAIPGQIDDVLIAAAKPAIHDTIKSLIDGI